jgi:hypothetical protein
MQMQNADAAKAEGQDIHKTTLNASYSRPFHLAFMQAPTIVLHSAFCIT